MTIRLALLVALLPFLVSGARAASGEVAGLPDINNLRVYDDTFASSGQPTGEQLEALRDAGFGRVVYLAFSNSGDAPLADEDVLVKGLGMGYLHVPVDWSAPQLEEFETFAAYMQQRPEVPTLLHCVVNARASAFSFLYRVIHGGVPVARAKADMNTVWQPNAVWRDFIFQVLEHHDMSAACDGCDWTPSDIP